MPEILEMYAAGEAKGKGFVSAFEPLPPGKTIDDLNLEEVATHFQQSLDKVVVESDSFKGSDGAAGVIFGGGQKLYACGPAAFHFARTSQSALRVTPKTSTMEGFGKDITDMPPYKAVVTYKAALAAKDVARKTYADLTAHLLAMPNLGSAPGAEIYKYMMGSNLFQNVPKKD